MITSPRSFASRRAEILLLLIVVGLAFGLRFYHINYDLPFVYDQDEPMFVSHTLSMLKNRDLNPHWFGPPASTTMYLLAVLYSGIFLGGRTVGIFRSTEDFRNLFYSDPSIFYLSGRIVSAIFGVASIWLLYKIGKRLFGSPAGLLAATALALSPLHIILSQQVRMDIQMVFLLLVAFWYCLDILERQDWKSYLLAGFITGLAVVTKYPAVVFTLTIALSHFAITPTYRLRDHKKLVGSAFASVTGAFIGSPFLFLDFRTTLSDVAQEARPEHLGATGEGLMRNALWYLKEPIPHALSIAGLFFAAVGIICCLTVKQRSRLVLISFPLAFLFFISSLHLRWERWILPAIPFLCLLMAFGVSKVVTWCEKSLSRPLTILITIVSILLVLGPLFIGSVTHARAILTPYSTTVARQWIVEHIPERSRVLVEVYGPQLPSGLFEVFAVNENGHIVHADTANKNVLPQWEIGRIKDLGELQAQNIEYVVISDDTRFYNERQKYASEVATYEKTIGYGQLTFEVDSPAGVTRGPKIRIFKLGLLTLDPVNSLVVPSSQ